MNKFVAIVSVILLAFVSLALPAAAHDYRRPHQQQPTGEEVATSMIALGFIALGVAVANSVSQPTPRPHYYDQRPTPRSHWGQGNQVRSRPVLPAGCWYKRDGEYTGMYRLQYMPGGGYYVCR